MAWQTIIMRDCGLQNMQCDNLQIPVVTLRSWLSPLNKLTLDASKCTLMQRSARSLALCQTPLFHVCSSSARVGRRQTLG